LCNIGDWCVLCGIHSCARAISGVWCVRGSFVTGDLERLVCPLMLTRMGCFVGGVGFCDLVRLATLAKLVVMFGCLEALRYCSGVGPLGRSFIEFASKPCQRFAIRVDRGSGLESVMK